MTGPTLVAVLAVADNDVIGDRNQLPWRLPADLRHFKAVTLGKPVLMGRRTFESIGRPLPGRTNLVLTRNAGWRADGVVVVPTLDAAIEHCRDVAELMIIGGAELYRLSWDRLSRVELTEVHAAPPGDTRFPFDRQPWQETARAWHPPDADNGYPYSFVTLVRRPGPAQGDAR